MSDPWHFSLYSFFQIAELWKNRRWWSSTDVRHERISEVLLNWSYWWMEITLDLKDVRIDAEWTEYCLMVCRRYCIYAYFWYIYIYIYILIFKLWLLFSVIFHSIVPHMSSDSNLHSVLHQKKSVRADWQATISLSSSSYKATWRMIDLLKKKSDDNSYIINILRCWFHLRAT